MKKLVTIIVLFLTISIVAQSKYEKGMSKAFQLWGTHKSKEAGQLFERISKAEKNNWLPFYYAATIEIIGSFGVKEETVLKAKLNKAQLFLDEAMKISPDNPEILITQTLLNTAYMAFDGQKYGMSMSMKNKGLYSKVFKLAPNNPRVILSKAEADIGTARFFGQPVARFCKDIEKAIKLSKEEKITTKFYPKFMLKRAEQLLKQCEQK